LELKIDKPLSVLRFEVPNEKALSVYPEILENKRVLFL